MCADCRLIYGRGLTSAICSLKKVEMLRFVCPMWERPHSQPSLWTYTFCKSMLHFTVLMNRVIFLRALIDDRLRTFLWLTPLLKRNIAGLRLTLCGLNYGIVNALFSTWLLFYVYVRQNFVGICNHFHCTTYLSIVR